MSNDEGSESTDAMFGASDRVLSRQNAVLLQLTRSEAIDSGDLAAAYREITEAASTGLDVERVGVWFYESDEKDAMASPDLYLRNRDLHATAPVLSHTLFPTYFKELAKERVVAAHNAHTHPATSELSEAYLTPLGIGSLLDAPIRLHGKMIGIVCHEHVGTPRDWSQSDINFAGSMADAVARALAADARVKAQDDLRKANLELEERIEVRTRELAKTNQELLALHRTKDEMFQNVSHELRTPLTLILSPIEAMLERAELPPADITRLQSVRLNGLRLLSRINDLLDLAKFSANAVPFVARDIDAAALISRLVSEVRQPAEDSGIKLVYEGLASGVGYSLDESHLERIVLNFISNALKFTPAGGRAEVKLDSNDHGLQIAVSDTGIGVSVADQQRIFDRFHQVDHGGTRKFGGSGIGLSLVAHLTRLMGGTVSVSSKEGQGSTFSVWFPPTLRREVRGTESAELIGVAALARAAVFAGLTRPASPPRRAGDRGPLVVLAEDDPGVRNELMELLAPHYRVVSCVDGEQALETAMALRPHLVLLDIMMPKLDGLKVAAALREHADMRDTAIAVLSARGDLDDRVQGRRLGVDTYLTKPFHRDEILATVEGLLRSRMRLVGSYLLHERLGSGGQGQVFRAEHAGTGEPAAIKLVRCGDSAQPTASVQDRLQRERQALRELRHPNIVRVLEDGEVEGKFYVAMEYLKGRTGAQLVEDEGPLPPRVVIDVGVALCAALAAVHEANLIHRDIKCSNLMFVDGAQDFGCRLRVIDFGAVYRPLTTPTPTKVVGTHGYMAPELQSGQVPSVASDIFAVGVSLFYMSSGEMPFNLTLENEFTRQSPLGQAPTTPGSGHHLPRKLDLPGKLGDVIGRAMSTLPAERFGSAAQMREALLEVAQQLPDPGGEPIANDGESPLGSEDRTISEDRTGIASWVRGVD